MGVGGCADSGAVFAALDAVEAAADKLASLSLDALTAHELLTVLGRREVVARRAPVVEHRILNRLVAECSPTQWGGTSWTSVLALRLRVSKKEARRRLDEAADLGSRTALTGECLAPKLPNMAREQAAGTVSSEHVAIVQTFFATLPAHVDAATRVQCEADLARHGATLAPEDFRKVTDKLATLLDQDGQFSDVDRARRRGVTIGKQGPDGMSPIGGWLDPQARATWEAVLAKLAAPGMCNPADESPQVDGDPSQERAASDQRTPAQRTHDAFTAAGRAILASGTLGLLNGLPVKIIVSTTLAELEKAAGCALTAGGSLLPMSDVIRMASHAHHYLCLFDGNGVALHLGRTERFASPGQRIVLHARDRGCTAPGCTAPGYQCQAHHAVADWINDGRTDIDDLAFACGPHNRLIENTGWTTRKRADGITEWIPPPHLDTGQPRTNNHHHPERTLDPNNQAPHSTEHAPDAAAQNGRDGPADESHDTTPEHKEPEGFP